MTTQVSTLHWVFRGEIITQPEEYGNFPYPHKLWMRLPQDPFTAEETMNKVCATFSYIQGRRWSDQAQVILARAAVKSKKHIQRIRQEQRNPSLEFLSSYHSAFQAIGMFLSFLPAVTLEAASQKTQDLQEKYFKSWHKSLIMEHELGVDEKQSPSISVPRYPENRRKNTREFLQLLQLERIQFCVSSQQFRDNLQQKMNEAQLLQCLWKALEEEPHNIAIFSYIVKQDEIDRMCQTTNNVFYFAFIRRPLLRYGNDTWRYDIELSYLQELVQFIGKERCDQWIEALDDDTTMYGCITARTYKENYRRLFPSQAASSSA